MPTVSGERDGASRGAAPTKRVRPAQKSTGIQFVNLNPGDSTNSAAIKRVVRSHAATDAHARARRQRMKEHHHTKQRDDGQQQEPRQEPQQQQQQEEAPPTDKPVKDRSLKKEEPADMDAEPDLVLNVDPSQIVHMPNPANLLSAARKDPFSSMALEATPLEHILIDHCKYSSSACFASL